MTTIRRTFELDAATAARLEFLAAERGQDPAQVITEAVALLGSAIDLDGPDIREDVRRLREFERTNEAVPGTDMMAWVESWGSDHEVPLPKPRKIG
jgi:predicted transcriptional regulator